MTRKREFRWRPNREQVLWSVGIAIALVLLISYGIDAHWTGFRRSPVNDKYDPAKTLWDWLDILIVPFVLALGGYLFNESQNRATLDAAKERTQNEALQAYLDKMSELLIDRELHKKADPYDETRITARSRTLAILRQLDGEGKKNVLLFLREARLINRYDYHNPEEEHKVLYHAHYVGLGDADLSGADLRHTRLISSSWKEPISLQRANLKGATLIGAILFGADLRDADLRDADLGQADLREVDLRELDLPEAVLDPAELRKANLTGASLRGANLRGAKGITNEELAQQACSLEGATMPDGRKYEDWLNSSGVE
jgi:uncharacterized protein YjbI with pentapeptide repeats